MNLSFMDTSELLTKALKGEKLFPDEAIYLCEEGDLLNLAMAAGRVARHHNPEGRVGYAVSKTVVYSNVCQPNCPFCTGTVTKDDPAAFTKTVDEVVAEVGEAVANGATQVTLQGGHRIDLPWEYYTGLVRAVKDRFPDVQIFAYSPTEIMVFNVVYQKTTGEVIADLQAAGMGALLAGGAETMTTRVPEYRALLRGPWNEWFDVVHRCADAGIPVVLPFVFGLGEPLKERVGHLYRSRAVQERTALAKKPAFVAMSVFTLTPGVTGHEYLRMLALARVLVPNVPHVQSSFVSQGAKVAQVALDGGADDLGGTHMEYDKAELAAGRTGAMTAAEMERLTREAGRIPQPRKAW
ncbi:MAG TPA: radical SAM protein [Symbiobacteriaceae bacterium]|nr:radical SAM protein [Symbiobacteriaceae bacterium]